MPALDKLIAQRSALAEDVRAYYCSLIDRLDLTPWYYRDRLVRARAIAIPFNVIHRKRSRRASRIAHLDDRYERGADWSSNDSGLAASRPPLGAQRRLRSVRWNVEELGFHRAIVVGPPGSGKSFLANKTIVDVAKSALANLDKQRVNVDRLPVPVHLDGGQLGGPLPAETSKDTLISLIDHSRDISDRLKIWLRNGIDTERGLVVVDAIDQVEPADRRNLYTRLRTLGARLGPGRILLTCRTTHSDFGRLGYRTLDIFKLAPFGERELSQLVDRWFDADDNKRNELHGILKNNDSLRRSSRSPLVATLICVAHAENPLTRETRVRDLYGRVLRDLLRRAGSISPRDADDPRVEDLEKLLERVASELLLSSTGPTRFTNSRLLAAIDKVSTDLVSDPLAIRDELVKCGVLVSHRRNYDGDLQYSFSLQEFLLYLVQPTGPGRTYVIRQDDELVAAAISRENKDNFVALVSGPRQVGKTSLIKRASEQVKTSEVRVLFTDFQKFRRAELQSYKQFIIALAGQVASELKLAVNLRDGWDPMESSSKNLANYVRDQVMGHAAAPLNAVKHFTLLVDDTKFRTPDPSVPPWLPG